MKGKISLLTRKVFATVIAIAMSLPPTAFANNDSPKIYNMDSSVMGVREDNEEKLAEVNNTDETKLEKDLGDYTLEVSSTLDESLEKIDYTIIARRKETLEDNSDKNLSLTLTNTPVSNIKKLNLVSVNTDTEENELKTDSLKGLHLTSKASDEIIYKLTADVKKAKNDRAYKLVLGLIDENEKASVISYNLKVKTTKEVRDQEEAEVIALELDGEEKSSAIGEYKKEGILGGIFASNDSITWTDYLVNEENENKEFTYDFALDENQNTENSQINLDYYELTENGFEIKKEFSQAIDFAEKINFEIPQGFVAKITLKTEVDKKNTAIKNYSLNNRVVKNPIYIEGSEEKNKDGEEDPLPPEEKEYTEESSSNKTENEKIKEDNPTKDKSEESTQDKKEEPSLDKEEKTSDTEIKVTDSTGKEIEEKDTISALILNKDSLISKLESEDKLTDELKSFIEELANNLTSYNEEKITDQELKDFTKALVENNQIEEADLRLYLESILSGLNKQKNKAANLNLDEIIDYAYPEEKDSEEEKSEKDDLTNLEKADKELKAALADEKNGIKEIQALLDSFEEKYNLSREDQEKLMTANEAAIKALVEKDRKDNTRFNNLYEIPQEKSYSFADKEFYLDTVMQVKASPGLPIPIGWHLDVKVGKYLKIDGTPGNYDPYILDLTDENGNVVAQGKYYEDGDNHYIRYTFTKRLTKNTDLKIKQFFKFDTGTIGDKEEIDVTIKMAPKNYPEQSMKPKRVSKTDDTPVFSNKVIDQGETGTVKYPYQLDWKTNYQKLKDKNGNEITSLIDPKLDGAYVEWDIEVDTRKLVNSTENLVYNRLYLTIFGSANQGLENFSYKVSTSQIPENDKDGFRTSARINEILTQDSFIDKKDLGEKLYIRVKAPIDKNHVHETYSIGFRINPDNNYIENLLNEWIDKFNNIPTPIKWLKGLEGARRFTEVPFNLVETMIPATFNGLRDKFTNEKFYYDNTRTIVADRKNDNRTDWFALDLLRRGENQDTNLDNPTFDINNGSNEQTIKPKKFYYVPKKDGGYRRTAEAGDAIINGQYYPGTIVSYEYENQTATRDDTYNLRVDLKDKKKFNVDESYEYEGGHFNLFTEKVSKQAIENGYIAYTEDPYPIMRIDKNFDLVSCFNDRVKAPVQTGSSNGVLLDKHEDVSGDYLISRLNESIFGSTEGHQLRLYLKEGNPYDGVYLNHDGMSEGQAMEELMKKIYFYGEEVKKEYARDHDGKEMHRLIEGAMYQRVIHHFTDNKSLKEDYGYNASENYNVTEWRVEHTLQGNRQTYPKTGWEGSFDAHIRKIESGNAAGLRKLKDNETRISSYPPVQRTSTEMATALYNKVINSYREGNDWNNDKANSVKLVFYSHTDEGKYQELIAGRVMAPIEIEKLDMNGNKLENAEFTFINIDTGERKEWTSDKNDASHKLYLRPGKYKVEEIAPPNGFQKIKDFNIEVISKEINPDDGSYNAKKLSKIHVNDGFVTEVKLDTNIPESTDGKKLVTLDENKIKVSVKNVEDNLGKFEFIKKNEFVNLDGAQFTLRKLKDEEEVLNRVKSDINSVKETDYDDDHFKPEVSTGNRGEFIFEQIPVGYYILTETKAPAGYKKTGPYLLQGTKGTDASGKATVIVKFIGDNAPTESENNKPIVRNHPKDTDIEFRKIREIIQGEDKQGLKDAKFRLESLWTKDGSNYLKDLTSNSLKFDNGEKANTTADKGYFRFDGLIVGDYKLTEIQAPYGYQVTDSYWRIEVRENEKGELVKTVYEVKKDGSGERIIKPNDEPVYELTNKPRKIDVDFTKSLGELEKNPDGRIKLDKNGKPIIHKNVVTTQLNDKDGKPVSFDLYNADYYGAIIGKKVDGKIQPFQSGITQDEKGIFHLKGLEFGKYYVLRETNPPVVNGVKYDKANDIVLKVEAEAFTSVGEMKVIVRDPNTNAETGLHSIFKGVIDFKEGEQLGKFSIRKTGTALSYIDKETGKLVENPQEDVGLRRAYFRLYYAKYDKNTKEFKKELNAGGFPEYIQKVTPGNPIILYLTLEQAEALKTTDPDAYNKLGIKGTKEFYNKEGGKTLYPVDKDGKRFRIGEDPSTLPKNQGIVTFDNLKPGYYILEEFRGPAGYEKTTKSWYVYVDDKGRTFRSENKDDPVFQGENLETISSITNPSMSPRLQMAGLDISEPIQFNRLLSPSLEEDLQDIEYDSNTENLNIKVKASKVDKTNGKRTISLSISPKEKEIAGKKIQMVFLVERSKDSATTAAGQNIAQGRTLDKNINYAITQIAKKAEETGTQVDVSFIEYTDTKTALKTTNASLNDISKSLQDTKYENMYFDNEGNKPNQTYKDFLTNASISARNGSITDGSDKLLNDIDPYLKSISKDGYDKKIMIDFANFPVSNVKRYDPKSGNYKFKKADLVNKFKDSGFETFVAHTDQRVVNVADGYQSQYAYTVMPQLKYFEYFNNSGSPGRNSASYYVYKNMVDEILKNDAFVNNGDGLLVKDGKLNIGLEQSINLLSTSASIGTNDISNNIVKDSTNNTISLGGINLNKGEGLEFSYTIDLKKGTDFDTDYEIANGMKLTVDEKENIISKTYPITNKSLYTKKIKEEQPLPNTYKVIINQSENGSVTASKSTNIKENEEITLTDEPSKGYRLKELKVTDAKGKDIPLNGNTFTMPASDVTVTATFERDSTPSEGEKNLEVNFTYSGSENGEVIHPNPNDSPGKLVLEEIVDGQPRFIEEKLAINSGKVTFEKKLDPNKNYRLVYTRDRALAEKWALPTVSNYIIDSKSISEAKDTVTLTIANGNTMDIYNEGETGFRIPLRITKVNENGGVLTGAKFRARKLLKSDQVIEDKPPKYGNDAFDGTSEATGLPGDNYFRELSPGIYELTEIQAPSGAYRLPKDNYGKDKKWYFRVEVAKDEFGNFKKPSDDDYMKIEFKFTEKLPTTKTDPRWALAKEEIEDDLLGKEIKGIKLGDDKYDKFTQIIKDDHRSDPARPDAPYKGIDDVQVTNFLKTTQLSFKKKDLETYQDIAGAEFTLKRAKVKKDGSLDLDATGNPQYENLNDTETGDDGKEYDKFIKPEPYVKEVNGAKTTSQESSGVLFNNIAQGTYILQETKPKEGYKLNENFLAITFKSDEKGYWKQEIVAYEKDGNGYKIVENSGSIFRKNGENGDLDAVFNNKVYIDFKFQKIQAKKVDGNVVPVESADFRVTQVDKDGNKVVGGYDKPINSYTNSIFEFKNLPVGRYKLEETRVINKFEKPDPWFFNVVQDPNNSNKLKIVFENNPDGTLDKSIGFKTKQSGEPDYDEDGNLQDIKIRNYTKTNFSFVKLSSEKDDKGNLVKKPLKDAYFRLKKVRFSMDEGAKTYEYYGEDNNATLKKYVNGKKVTEYTPDGTIEKYTYDGKEIQAGSEDYKPDAVTAATGKYSSLRRSQSNGNVDFQGLGEGIYQLEEVGIPEGYQSANKQFKWIFKVEKTDDGLKIVRTYKDAKGNDHDIEEEYFKKYDNKYYNDFYLKNKFKQNSNVEGDGSKDSPYEISNAKTTTELKWKKVGPGGTTDVIKKKTKFVLLKTSTKSDQDSFETAIKGQSNYDPYIVEEDDGEFVIPNLTKGIYALVEVEAPEGYEKSDSHIAIRIYEDASGNLKKEFAEVQKVNGVNTLVKTTKDFDALLHSNGNLVTNEGTFYVVNKQKPNYFYLSKGYLNNNTFKEITAGKLKIKIEADKADKNNNDTKVYEQEIDLSQKGPYRIDVNGIHKGVDYILTETEAPDGYTISKNKYRIQFAQDSDGKLLIKLMAVIGPDGQVLKGIRNPNLNRTEDGDEFSPTEGYYILGPSTGTANNGPLKIFNNQVEIEFTKVGEDEKAQGGEKPLANVGFYLEKQDSDDIQKENEGYYPLTKDMEFIKSEVGKDGNTHYYIERANGDKDFTHGGFGFNPVTIENSAKKYTSDDKGKFTITGLTDGYYRVIEPKAPKDYMQVNGAIKTFRVEKGKVWIYTKNKDGSITEDVVTDTNKDTLAKIVNKKPGKGEFELTKVDGNDKTLEGVEFTLHQTDAAETQVGDKVYKTDKDGKIKFTGLPYGYYWLKEKKTKDGYILDTKKKLIALGGGDWGETPAKRKDVSKAIKFNGKQDELVSTADKPNNQTVYPNKAEGMIAKFNFKIDKDAAIKPGDYFTLNFSDNVDLDGIFKTNEEEGNLDETKLNIVGPAGTLAEAKVNPDRKSITYVFTNYVGQYKPDFMSMFVQLYPNRKMIDHTQDITVTSDIGDNTDKTNTEYHYSDSININYRGKNTHTDKNGTVTYDGYQNPNFDVSSYTLRLDPQAKTFTAIVYLNPWNNKMIDKKLSFETDQDILVNDKLSVKTYIKTGKGSHKTEDGGWQAGDLPDSYDIYLDEKDQSGNLKVRPDLTFISDKYDWKSTKVVRKSREVNYYDGYDYYQYDYTYGVYRYYKYYYEADQTHKETRQIDIPYDALNRQGDPSTATYVIEIKGQLKDNAKALKTWSYETHYNFSKHADGYTYKDTYNSHFETWSQFFNPGGFGGASKEIELVNFKNKIEFAKVDGGVAVNVVDKSEEDPATLKDKGIGLPLKDAEFKLQKLNGSSWDDVDSSTRVSDKNGIFSWEGLPPGRYQVIETKSPDKDIYDLPTKALASFEVDPNGNIINIRPADFIVENYRKAEIEIKKTDQDGEVLPGADFLLTPTSGQKNPDDPTKPFEPTNQTTNENGIARFEKLPAGKYTLQEVKAPKGYSKSDTVWNIEVTRDGKVKWLNSFDDTNDKMKAVTVKEYANEEYKGDTYKDKLFSEILGIDEESKIFRQKITIKARPSELNHARLILDSLDKDLKLTQLNTKVRLVQAGENNTIKDKDNTSYTVEIDNNEHPKMILKIKPPYINQESDKQAGSQEGGQKEDLDAEREYQFIVDMPYKDDTRIGAKVTYDVGSVDKDTGKVTFGENDIKTELDKYATKANLTIGTDNVDMAAYKDKYLARDINLITTDIGNVKQPDIYFEKVDAANAETKLSGAVFELQKKQADGTYKAITKDSKPFIPSGTNASDQWTATSGEKGEFSFKSIPDGEYKVVEAKAPDGYSLINKDVYYFEVKNGKITGKVNLDETYKELTDNSAEKPIQITNRKAQYPSTGGPGVWIGFTVIGLAVMIAGAFIYNKRQARLTR